METKETWINQTINALDGIQPVKGDPDLYGKIETRLHKNGKQIIRLQPILLWPAAAGLVLLLTLNILAWTHYHSIPGHLQETPNVVATEYLYYLEPIKF